MSAVEEWRSAVGNLGMGDMTVVAKTSAKPQNCCQNMAVEQE
jgi:hypothetical protein